MLKVYINSGLGEVDYTRFVVDQSISIERSINTPSTCKLSLANYDSTFQYPALRSYLRIFSTKYNKNLFTGFLTVDPTKNFLAVGGKDNQTHYQLFQYDLTFTSDEYLLNIKSVDFIPAWVNQSQGQILQNLAETLCPGFFNYDHIASGQLVPYEQYDPTQSWSELAKKFADASRFRYSVVGREIHYQPYGDGELGITYDERDNKKLFDPFALQTSAFQNPIVNDVTMIGAQEAGNNHEDYFMGDGFTGAFPLRHQVFNAGGQSGNSSAAGSIVLSESWNEQGTINSQIWTYQDPQNNFNYVDGALNIITGAQNPPQQSYIQALNGLELAGGLVAQHGEFVFNDISIGILGGMYDDATNNPATCESGFYISPSLSVGVTASGASGIQIQPYRFGQVLANPGFNVITKINHTYVLTTIVHAPAPARYTQTYKTIAGTAYGAATLSPNVLGSITWKVEETDLLTGAQNQYSYTLADIEMPSFVVYGVVNNIKLNITAYNTQIYAPPLGTLGICSAVGAGLLGEFYLSGNQFYTGAYTYPSGGNLPIPLAYVSGGQVISGGLGPEQQWPLGSSLQNQTAEIDIGTLNSTLNFYSNDLPGVGTRIRLQSWESQAALSRVQVSGSIAEEAFVVGDDGIRASVVNNMNPQPRTSEDCDAAAAAYVSDRISTYYQGTYKASYLFFNQLTDDIDFYPVPGRYLKVYSPQRGLDENELAVGLLVSAVTTTVTEMFAEIMDHTISFGPDLYLEKVLANFVEYPTNVLLPQDTVVKLTPQQLEQIGVNYLNDVQTSKFDPLSISGSYVVLNLNDTLPAAPLGVFYEVRNADLNWGRNDSHLMYRFYANGKYTLPRTSYEQVWYIRMVYVNGSTIQASRRSKVLRLYWPQTPTPPYLLYADSTGINVDFSGDIRNIEGVELRSGGTVFPITQIEVIAVTVPFFGTRKFVNVYTAALPSDVAEVPIGSDFLFAGLTNYTDLNGSTLPLYAVDGSMLQFAVGALVPVYGPSPDTGTLTLESGSVPQTTYYQSIAGSEYQLMLNLVQMRGQLPVNTPFGLGQYLLAAPAPYQRYFAVYFFNLMWEYSEPLYVYIPPLDPPVLDIGYRWGAALQVRVAQATRQDVQYTHLQVATDSGFTGVIVEQESTGNPGSFSSNVPTTGDLWARATFFDFISSGGWSNVLHIPQGDLIASDYLSSQGSVPPAIAAQNTVSGGIFTYGYDAGILTITCLPFSAVYPNGAIDVIAEQSASYTGAIDSSGGFLANTNYGFFPAIKGPTTPAPVINFNGPYLKYGSSSTVEALRAQFQDGSVPLTNGPFVVQTAYTPSGSSGGGGGGTYGGATCGVVGSKLRLLDGREINVEDVAVNRDVVWTPSLKGSKVRTKKILRAYTLRVILESGVSTCVAYGHVVKAGHWLFMGDLYAEFRHTNEPIYVETVQRKFDRVVSMEPAGEQDIVMIELDGPEHVYMLDGIKAHNVVKVTG